MYVIFSSSTDATVNGFVPDPDISKCTKASCWDELPCGIYSIHMKNIRKNGTCAKEGWIVEVNTHEWMDSSLNKLIQWERKLTVPAIEKSSIDGGNHHSSQNFVSSGESEENNKNGVMKIDLLSNSSLGSANCITQSGKWNICCWNFINKSSWRVANTDMMSNLISPFSK